MSRLEDKLNEDRILRDAARRNVLADVENLRENLSGQRIVSRVFGRVGDGAVDVLERAKEQAEDKRGVLAALIAALFVWLAREPILELLGLTDNLDTSGDDNSTAGGDTSIDDTPAAEAGDINPSSGDDNYD